MSLTVATDADRDGRGPCRRRLSNATDAAGADSRDRRHLGQFGQIGDFTIVKQTDVAGQSPLTVVPPNRDDHRPDYRLSARPGSGSTTTSTAATRPTPFRRLSRRRHPGELVQWHSRGGFFEAITNGACVNPLTFTIVGFGRQPDDGAPHQRRERRRRRRRNRADPVTPPSVNGAGSCTGKTFSSSSPAARRRYNVAPDRPGRPSRSGADVRSGAFTVISCHFHGRHDDTIIRRRYRHPAEVRQRTASPAPDPQHCARNRERRPADAPFFLAPIRSGLAIDAQLRSTRRQLRMAARPSAVEQDEGASPPASTFLSRAISSSQRWIGKRRRSTGSRARAIKARAQRRVRRRQAACVRIESLAASTMPAATASPCSQLP